MRKIYKYEDYGWTTYVERKCDICGKEKTISYIGDDIKKFKKISDEDFAKEGWTVKKLKPGDTFPSVGITLHLDCCSKKCNRKGFLNYNLTFKF